MKKIVCYVCVMATLLLPFTASSENTPTGQGAGPAAQTASTAGPAREIPETHRDKLKVEQILVKGPGEKGIEIEISYRIVNTDRYGGHPKSTFIADETSKRLVPLTVLAKLFTPLPEEEAMAQPPAILTLWDKEGVIRPGQPVTVVVAGYGQQHLLPEEGPGFDPGVYQRGETVQRGDSVAREGATVEVMKAMVVAGGHLMKVIFRSSGLHRLSARPEVTYVEDLETGKRYPIAHIPRLGAMAPRELGEQANSYMVIDNSGYAMKEGQRVAVSVNGVRDEDVIVTLEPGLIPPEQANTTETADDASIPAGAEGRSNKAAAGNGEAQ